MCFRLPFFLGIIVVLLISFGTVDAEEDGKCRDRRCRRRCKSFMMTDVRDTCIKDTLFGPKVDRRCRKLFQKRKRRNNNLCAAKGCDCAEIVCNHFCKTNKCSGCRSGIPDLPLSGAQCGKLYQMCNCTRPPVCNREVCPDGWDVYVTDDGNYDTDTCVTCNRRVGEAAEGGGYPGCEWVCTAADPIATELWHSRPVCPSTSDEDLCQYNLCCKKAYSCPSWAVKPLP